MITITKPGDPKRRHLQPVWELKCPQCGCQFTCHEEDWKFTNVWVLDFATVKCPQQGCVADLSFVYKRPEPDRYE